MFGLVTVSRALFIANSSFSLFQDERVRGRKREERSTDSRARQKEQPMGRERQMRHHVETGDDVMRQTRVPYMHIRVSASAQHDIASRHRHVGQRWPSHHGYHLTVAALFYTLLTSS